MNVSQHGGFCFQSMPFCALVAEQSCSAVKPGPAHEIRSWNNCIQQIWANLWSKKIAAVVFPFTPVQLHSGFRILNFNWHVCCEAGSPVNHWCCDNCHYVSTIYPAGSWFVHTKCCFDCCLFRGSSPKNDIKRDMCPVDLRWLSSQIGCTQSRRQRMVILSEICHGNKCKQVCLDLLPLTDFAASVFSKYDVGVWRRTKFRVASNFRTDASFHGTVQAQGRVITFSHYCAPVLRPRAGSWSFTCEIAIMPICVLARPSWSHLDCSISTCRSPISTSILWQRLCQQHAHTKAATEWRLDMVECGEAFCWVIASLAMAMFGNVCVSKVAHTNTATEWRLWGWIWLNVVKLILG